VNRTIRPFTSFVFVETYMFGPFARTGSAPWCIISQYGLQKKNYH